MFVVIVNPTAGGGETVSICRRVCALLEERRIAYRIEETCADGHATQLAREAVKSGCSAIVGVGGDGTLSEIASGLTARAVPLYFVPCGTGNDFARMLHLPSDPVAAMAAQLDGEDCRLDMGMVNGHGFLNVAGTGFDVEVLKEVTGYKHLGKGLLPYVMGLIAALRKFRSFKAELTLDTGEVLTEAFTIISFGNGRYFGGGMKVAPYADLQDGLMDVMIIRSMPVYVVPFLLPLFIGGWHAKLKFICRRYRCRKATLVCPGMTFNLDGELTNMDTAEIQILPGHLPARLPGARRPAVRKKAA